MPMGLFGTAFNIMGGVTRGATAASMWTGNMIYTSLQNARTKKDIRDTCQRASEANYKNRCVATLPGVDRQQLMLVSGDPSENDIYDYSATSKTAALDYIWGESDDPEGIIVSGGQTADRVCALIPFVHKAQQQGLPVIAIHAGNDGLNRMIKAHSVCSESISKKDLYYDVFRGMPVEDIAFLLYETMPGGNANPAAEALLRALLEILSRTVGNITIQSLSAFPLASLKTKIDDMQKTGELDPDEYAEINGYFISGSSETDAVRVFLNRLSRQAENVYGKINKSPCNIKRVLNQKGVVSIDAGGSGNDILLSLIANHLSLLQSQGREFAVLIDGIPLSRSKKLVELAHYRVFAISSNDFVASLFGGESRGEDLFPEITGNAGTVVLFRHASGTSCKKWSEHLGTYNKIHIRFSLSQNQAFMNSSNSRGLSVDEKEEPRVRAETIGKLPDGLACIHTMGGTLIAEVNGP